MSNPADAKQPSATDRLLKVATHQAQNLESLKNEGQWLHGRVESIDQFLTTQSDQAIVELKVISNRLGHLKFWAWFWSIIAIVAFLNSLVSTTRGY